jgi:hypothetical protein
MSTLGQRVESILIELADCLCQEIRKREMPTPCFCGVLPGDEAPLNYCNACQGGQAWVRLVSVGAPEGDLSVPTNACAGIVVVQVEMGMVHGYLPIDDDGEPADLSTALAATTRQIDEMDVMYHVLTCCSLSMREKVSNLGYTPVGPDGTCLGGIWTGMVPVI